MYRSTEVCKKKNIKIVYHEKQVFSITIHD